MIIKKIYFFLFVFFYLLPLYSQILVISHQFNRPDFIKLQYDSLKKHLKDEYVYIIFNDATDIIIEQKIAAICSDLNIECIRIDQKEHYRLYNPRYKCSLVKEPLNHILRRGNVVQYSFEKKGFDHSGIVAVLDSDIFLLRDFSIKEYMQDCAMAGTLVIKDDISYLWPGLLFIDMNLCVDKQQLIFTCKEETDPGQQIYLYKMAHPEFKIKYFDCLFSPLCNIEDFNGALKKFILLNRSYKFEILLNHTFLHYKGGTNWNCYSSNFHQLKTKLLQDFLNN